MNEMEWLSSVDPAAMLAHVQGKVSERRLRLFAVSCCRQVWHLLTDERSRRAVEVAERYADGDAGQVEVDRAFAESFIALEQQPGNAFAAAAHGCLYEASLLERVPRQITVGFPDQAQARPPQAALLREIVGNPFRPVSRWQDYTLADVPHVWLTPTVRSLAQACYDTRAGRVCRKCGGLGNLGTAAVLLQLPLNAPCPDCHGTGRIEDGSLDNDRLAVLADALEDAGCTDEVILRHLRGWERCTRWPDLPHNPVHGTGVRNCLGCDGSGWIPLRGPHVRGCHILDLLLGRE